MNSVLELTPAIRPRVDFPSGTHQSERHFLDFVVDGHSLWQVLGKRHDMVSVLCNEYATDETSKAIDELLLEKETEIPNGRRRLFICSECGDLGCGAITAVLLKDETFVTWKDFGYENDYEKTVRLEDYKSMGPFRFGRAEYEATLRRARGRLGA